MKPIGQGEGRLAQTEQIAGDAEIIKMVLDGKVNAFEDLLKRHQNHAARIIRGKVPPDFVEEVLHDTFVSVFKSLHTFRGDKPFEHWLARIAVRTCYDYWRRVYKNQEIPVSALTPAQEARLEMLASSDDLSDGREDARGMEDKELLDWAMGHLTPKDRMALTLIHLEGLSVSEAAELLGWSTANVKVRTFRARMKLRKVISREMQL